MKIAHAVTLNDTELTAELARLAGREREAGVALLVHLAEFDRRRLHEGLGFSSTFEYCLDVLHMSEDAIDNRIEAARAARQFPRILEMLAAGSLSLTTARLVGRRLTADNERELLTAVAWLSKARVEELLARWFPRPEVAPAVRKLPAPVNERAGAAPPVGATLRAVVVRDRGRCAFVSKTGHRCGGRRCLEFHHVVPYAVGGTPAVENIALRCNAHNDYEVDRFFGPGVRRGGPPLPHAASVRWSEVVPERPAAADGRTGKEKR